MKRTITLLTNQLGSNSHALTKHIYHSKHQIWFLLGERLRVMGKDSKREGSAKGTWTEGWGDRKREIERKVVRR